MESILTSIKKLLGIAEEYEHFDQDLIMHINSVFMILTQLGVGPSKGFMITDSAACWDDFIPIGSMKIESVKTYMYMKVKLMFDPPLSSAVMESMNRMINELEWRLNVAVESTDFTSDSETKVYITGQVVNCKKLNIRAAAREDSIVIAEILEGAKVAIDDKASTTLFYKVVTAGGIEGYCLREFIKILM